MYLLQQFPTEAMQWIKEVEMVDSVDDLKSSSVCQRNSRVPNFEVLDVRIVSALNKIIHGRQIAYLICEYFWVTGANDSVENYADLLHY